MDSQDGLDQTVHPTLVVFNFTSNYSTKEHNTTSTFKIEKIHMRLTCSMFSHVCGARTHNALNTNNSPLIVQSLIDIGCWLLQEITLEKLQGLMTT
jgi:hypothetical protein